MTTTPRLPPYLHGMTEICAYLEAIGMRLSFNAIFKHLKSGSLVNTKNGRVVSVRSADFRAWVASLTGRTYDQWITYWISRGRPRALWTASESEYNPVIGYAEGLVTLLEPDPALGEVVVRLENGAAFVTFERETATDWRADFRVPPYRAVRWKKPRMVRTADLGKSPEGPSAPAASFVTVLLMRNARLRFVSVPSALFGSPARTSTIAAAPIAQPRWPEIREYVLYHHPDAIWVVWTHREDLDLATMKPAGEPAGKEHADG